MDANFEAYSSVTHSDAVLRNAIRLDCADLVERAFARGADINCRYARDWNTPLHLAIINRCQPAVLDALLSHNPDCGLVNGENLTACELALRGGLRELGRKLIDVEFGNVGEPEDALYEMLQRNSVTALELLIQMLRLEETVLVELLAKAWSRLEVMNVAMNSEIVVFVHLRIVREDYERSFGTERSKAKSFSPGEIEERMELIISAIDCLERTHDTGLCHDVTDEFLERLRLIQRHLFVVKNRAANFPAMQLEYCVAMYLAIFDRKPELDLFQLVINKRLLINYLKQFKAWHSNPDYEQRMTPETLLKLTSIFLKQKEEKCKTVIEKWNDEVQLNYNVEEQILIRNQILKSQLLLNKNGKSFENLTTKEQNLESNAINTIFETIKMKRLYKSLYRTYFKLKQTYSLQKSIHYLSSIEKIELNVAKSCYVEVLAIQRVLQVLGETLKSTKLSPNISTNLRSVLELVTPGELLKWITRLRQYFSHEYSATKHTVYQRLRANDTDLIAFYGRVKADLLKVIPLMRNIYAEHIYKYFKSFLGYVLTMKDSKDICSYAEASRVRPGFKLIHDFQTTDVYELKKMLAVLEQSYDGPQFSQHLAVIGEINSKIANYIRFLNRNEINFMTEMVMCCIGELKLCDNLKYQQNLVHFYLRCPMSQNTQIYGVSTFLMHSCNKQIRELVRLETIMPDQNSLKRSNAIQSLIKMAASSDIEELHEFTLTKVASLTNFTQNIGCALVEEPLSDDQLKELNKQLQKYYANLFAIDSKYSVVKTFCKQYKLNYKNEAATRARIADVKECQKVLNDLVMDITDIISLPDNLQISDLTSLVASSGKYGANGVEVLALETVLQELLEILSDQGILKDNRVMLESFRPVVSGKNLRNYLAHDSLVYETICRNRISSLTVMLNAVCLSRFCSIDYSDRKLVRLYEPSFTVSGVHGWMCRVIDRKLGLFEAVEKGNFDVSTLSEFEVKARDHNKRTVLIAAMDHHSDQIIHFLMGKPTSVEPLMEKLIQKALNQEHNFYDDDEFTVGNLLANQSIRENMSFYLSLKYHHFGLEKELDLLYGGAYTPDSLHLAIIFGNEESALSIIDDDRLYTYCKQDTALFQNSILTNAVLHKLPRVIRRICEISPELLQRTNCGKETPLRLAISTSCRESIQILLEFGAKVFTNPKSPITYALQARKDDILELLLPSDQELLQNHQLLSELVIQAGSAGHHILLKKLLSNLPGAISQNTLIESLHMSILDNQLESVRLVLNFDSRLVDLTNSSGCTPLLQACNSGSDAMVKLLLKNGADCTLPKQDPAVLCAIDRYRKKQFQIMLKQNIDSPELQDRIFQRLKSGNRHKWIWLILHAGFPLNIIENWSKIRKAVDDSDLKFMFEVLRFKKDFVMQIDTYTLANAVLLGNCKFVEYVVKNRQPTKLYGFDTARLLNCAVKANNKNMLAHLVDAGCDVNSSDSDGITPLAMAVTIGKPDMVKTLIKYKANPNLLSMGHCSVLLDTWNIVTDQIFEALGGKIYRTYPLILAAMNSNPKIAEYLLKQGAEADIRDADGFTTLIVAFALGYVDLIKTLRNHGANVEYARSFTHSFLKGGCALHYAAKYGLLTAIKWMVEQCSFDLETKDSDGNTVLHLGIINRRVEVVQYLLGENLWDVRNKKGQTPLMLAFENLDERIFMCIKSIPACKEEVRRYRGAENRTLLHAAVWNGSCCIVQVLLREFDIDSDWLDDHGNTAVYYAIHRKNFELVSLLMDAGVSLACPSGHQSMPPFAMAVILNQLDITDRFLQKEDAAPIKLKEYCAVGKNLVIFSIMQNHFKMCKLLLESVAFDLNVEYENGNAALHAAAAKSSLRMVALILEHGAHIDKINHDGKTALLIAIEHGNCRVVHYLLANGACKQITIDYRYKGDQALNVLHFVAAKGELDSIKYLLQHDFFEPSETDANGRTMAHHAATNKQHAVVEFLISSSISLDLLDHEGRSPLVCALENEDLQLAKRLKSIGVSLDVVQKFNQDHSFLTRVIAEKKTDLARFLIAECFLETSVALDSILVSLDKKDQCVQPLENTKEAQGSTPILVQHLLAGNRSLAEALINDEASLEELRNFRLPTRDQETVLHVVSRNGLISCLKLLLEKAVWEVDVGDFDQTTALQGAAMFGQLECVRLLLQYGANMNFVDLQHTTALTRAVTNLKKEVANFLIDRGAELDNTRSFRVTSCDNSSVLHYVIEKDVSLAKLLVNRVGMDVNVRDDSERTALHYVAMIGSIEGVEILLKLGANPDLCDDYQRTPFVTALQMGHHDTAERLLAATSDREYLRNFRLSDSQQSILHIALEKGCIRLFMLLLNDYNLDSRCVDLNGKSVLHYAVAAGNNILIDQLQFDPNSVFMKDNFGDSPLSICLRNSNVKVFMALIQSLTTTESLILVFEQVLQQNTPQFIKHYGRWLLDNRKSLFAGNEGFIDSAKKCYDNNPLQLAILSDDRELFELFLECGLDSSFLRNRNFLNTTTWLHIAVIKNNHLLAKVVLDEYLVPVDCIGDHQLTPLSCAVFMRNTEIASLLLSYGANVNYQDPKKRTPLQSALENNQKEMVQLLLDNNASIKLLQEFRYNNDNENLIQHYLVERGLVDMLVSIISGIDLNHPDKHGLTPLHYAAACNQINMIDILIGAGATVDCFDKHGTTPLMRALSKGHLEAYQFLLDHGASVNLVKQFRHDAYDGETILHITAEMNRIAPTKLLVEELKFDVNCVDKNGNTPLHCAVGKKCFEVVKYLLGRRTNLHLRNDAGQTILQMLEAIDNDLVRPISSGENV